MTGYEDKLPLGENSLAMLNDLAEQQLAAEKAVNEAAAVLDRAERRLKDLSGRIIPEALEDLGMTSFETTGGLTMEVKVKIIAGLSEKNRVAGIKWLEDNGLGKLVKRKVTILAPKGEPEKAEDLVTRARADGLEIDDEESVHNTSLAAALREKMEDGEEVPLELMGVLRLRTTKVSYKKSHK